ncbi:unnamed protein product [Chondrus crispus]|uniref:Uncharacterized protein n=1 Tax=Chondrus crispus TaxID=2769 RepID=R7QQG4_CHOCR|nr:unnamed protein product [Chondrus crispus]CDF40742.1 unnamed protein product [Chondrus crispus]|eukprot:XP_005711036.1 unnamed protein product [Chondrus crispus]
MHTTLGPISTTTRAISRRTCAGRRCCSGFSRTRSDPRRTT